MKCLSPLACQIDPATCTAFLYDLVSIGVWLCRGERYGFWYSVAARVLQVDFGRGAGAVHGGVAGYKSL